MSDVFEQLQALSEPIRVRLLKLLAAEELSVGELVVVLQLPQSTVSRHLKHLQDRGFVQKRTEGTASLYRMDPLPTDAGALWEAVEARVDGQFAEDARRLERVLADRVVDSEAFFGRVANRWDAMRRELFGEEFPLPTLLSLLDPALVVADLGCGTGAIVAELAPVVARVIGVDREQAMLDAAATRCAAYGNVDLRHGLFEALPISDGEADAAVCMLVLHHVRDLDPVLAEFARAIRTGGTLVVLDMVAHEREEYARTMGHRHLGFERCALEDAARAAGLVPVRWRLLPAAPTALGPGLFVATFRRAPASR